MEDILIIVIWSFAPAVPAMYRYTRTELDKTYHLIKSYFTWYKCRAIIVTV